MAVSQKKVTALLPKHKRRDVECVDSNQVLRDGDDDDGEINDTCSHSLCESINAAKDSFAICDASSISDRLLNASKENEQHSGNPATRYVVPNVSMQTLHSLPFPSP